MGEKTVARILLVDDSDITRTLLRGADYDVVGEARDANHGIELAQSLRPDIICLDIEMPGTSGIDALPRFREVLPESQVLMVTGHTEREMVKAAIEGGASAYIVKPFNAAKVLDTIGATLAKSQAKQHK
jgi:two-component system chemotaxis response regulator CheY